MIIDPHYWSWTSELPDGVCDQIVEYGLSLKDEEGQAGDAVQPDKRKSRIAWVQPNHWISGIVTHYAFLANAQAWNFNIEREDGIQFTKYGVGEFYEAHMDTFKLQDNMRKVSIVIQLTDPKDYEGGDFVFIDGDDEFKPKGFSKRGSVLVFPSFLMHQVKPITSGTRHSIVSWFIGPKLQ